MKLLENVDQVLWVPGPLPGLNELLDAKAVTVRGRKGFSKYNSLKQRWSNMIALLVRAQRMKRIGPSFFGYVIWEPDNRRDPSNVMCGAVKIIEDVLQGIGILENDGREHVLCISSVVLTSPEKPGVMLLTRSDEPFSAADLLSIVGKDSSCLKTPKPKRPAKRKPRAASSSRSASSSS
jgi:hypothetical protein